MAAENRQDVAGKGNAFSGSGDVYQYNIKNIFPPGTPSPQPCSESGIFFGVPDLPPNYLPRQEYLEEFRAALQQESIGLTGAAHVGVQGMGGLGKSVLAIALARDEEVQAAFPHGIFWLTFGQEVKNDDLLAWQNTLLKLLGQQEPEESLDLGRHRLNETLHGKSCLFIIDDIWDSRHLKCFDLSGTDCRFLLTSRKADVQERLGIEGKPIELLSEEQALAMLARYSAHAVDDLPKEAAEIVKECGYLPLAVAAIGSMVKKNPARRWQLALRKLQEARLDKIAFKFDYQYENLFRALQVSVKALPEATQQYYATLAVFPEDANIPESVVTMYWEHCAFSDDYPEDVIDALVDASLLTRNQDGSLRLHDLLRDYLIGQTEDVASLHRQLLEAYKVAYPGGWHTIPYVEHFYFYRYWHVHVQVAGEVDLLNIIADNLIQKQPLLSPIALRKCLEFADYQLADIAPHLLKTSKNSHVIVAGLNILGNKAKEDARRFLQEGLYSLVIIASLKILGDEAKEDAKRLIKEHDNPLLIAACFGIVGAEAKEDARRLLKENEHPHVLAACLKILGKEVQEDAKYLLKKSDNSALLCVCLNILGDEAKEDARRLLKKNEHPHVLAACLNILDNEAKEEARALLNKNQHPEVVATCLRTLGDESKEDARYFLKGSKEPKIISACLQVLGNEANKTAWKLLKESQDDAILSSCLQILGKRAKKAAQHLLKTKKDRQVIIDCLHILEEDAKEDAKILLKESVDPNVQVACLKAIGKEAKDDAKHLLKETRNPELKVTCLLLLEDEAKEEAKELLSNTENPSIITACLTVLNGDAGDDAKRLLQTHSNPIVISACLRVLGDEAKKDARCFLKESQNPYILRECMHILGNEAKKDARRLLKSSENEHIMVACIENLGKEAKAEAEQLIKKSNNRFIRKECRELICSWETSIGSRFPELARLKKNLANK